VEQAKPIIIKRKKVAGGGGHHGGAWKVAYADFVTAMMAFFLLMWLLNATSEDQRKGLADFFDPSIPISRVSAGGAGMLNGDTAVAPPDAASTAEEGVRPKLSRREKGEDLGEEEFSPDVPTGEVQAVATGGLAPEPGEAENAAQPGNPADSAPSDDDLERMAEVVDGLMAELQKTGKDGLIKHFSLRVSPEGLIIEIGDLQGEPLFASGSAEPEPILPLLIDILTPILQRTTNDIAVVGHTDGRPFANRAGYSNWELSADRANAARRLFAESGLPAERIVRVTGKAATDPLVPDPLAPRNRRIAVKLLRNTGD